MKEQLKTELANHEDIFEYLRAEIHKKNQEVNELRQQKDQLLSDQERIISENEKVMQDEKDSFMELKADLQQKVASLQSELLRLQTFKEKEAELDAELTAKKRMLEDEAEAHATNISDLERKHVQEKDRLKKEMLLKLRETKANLLKMTDNQLDTTTKRTIAENEQMSSELAWQSKETEKLIRKNDKLVGESQALKRELSLHRQTQEEFAKKVNVYQKTIKTLLAKLNALDASQQAELARIHIVDDEKERERAEWLRERDQLETALEEVRARMAVAFDEITRLRVAQQEADEKHSRMLSLQDEAVKFTLQCLADMQMQMSMPQEPTRQAVDGLVHEADKVSEMQSLQTLDASQREQVLSYLLDQLKAYQHQLKELELHNAWRQHTASVVEGSTGVSLPPIVAQKAAHWSVQPPPQPLGDLGSGYGFADDVTLMAVGNPLRPWGKRAKPARAYR